mmetsp:Transcript_5414/g.12296  ORF Transcript_5414/g.12296 Transcript_5414/m.12296 type:complete len:393 (+) Transcript_5414:2475-3653(+)
MSISPLPFAHEIFPCAPHHLHQTRRAICKIHRASWPPHPHLPPRAHVPVPFSKYPSLIAAPDFPPWSANAYPPPWQSIPPHRPILVPAIPIPDGFVFGGRHDGIRHACRRWRWPSSFSCCRHHRRPSRLERRLPPLPVCDPFPLFFVDGPFSFEPHFLFHLHHYYYYHYHDSRYPRHHHCDDPTCSCVFVYPFELIVWQIHLVLEYPFHVQFLLVLPVLIWSNLWYSFFCHDHHYHRPACPFYCAFHAIPHAVVLAVQTIVGRQSQQQPLPLPSLTKRMNASSSYAFFDLPSCVSLHPRKRLYVVLCYCLLWIAYCCSWRCPCCFWSQSCQGCFHHCPSIPHFSLILLVISIRAPPFPLTSSWQRVSSFRHLSWWAGSCCCCSSLDVYSSPQ